MSSVPENQISNDFSYKLIIALLFASICPHLPYLWTYFFMDDFWHLAHLESGDYIFSTWQSGRENIDKIWYMRKEVFSALAWVEQIQLYFRPVYLVFLWLDYQLFEWFAPAYHIHSQIWHSLNTILLFILLQNLKLHKNIVLIACLTFAIHPMVAEPLGWISARCDLQMLSFCLLSAIFYFKWQSTGKIRNIILYVTMFILALGAKEHALTFPFIMLAYEASRKLFNKNNLQTKNTFAVLAINLVIALVFLAWRMMDSGGPATYSVPKASFAAFVGYGPLGVLAYNFIQYLKFAVSGIPPTSFIGLSAPLNPIIGAISLSLILATIFYLVWKLRNQKALFMLWWGLGFLFAMLWMPSSGRYFYPAAPGMAVIFAIAIYSLIKSTRPVLSLLGKALLGLFFSWWIALSLMVSFTEVTAHNTVKDAVNDMVMEIEKRPDVTDVYLMHLWPLMVSAPDVVPLMIKRENLKIHLLTFASTLYNPNMSVKMRYLYSFTFHNSKEWFAPLDISTTRLEENKLVTTSKPRGFFYGPAMFGWGTHNIPQTGKSEIQLEEMKVKISPVTRNKGIKSIMFSFKKALDDPTKLWLEWKDGKMQVWEP